MQNRNTAVDIAKFLAAIFVVGIHTRPLSDVFTLADFALTDILFRTAVPFFAVCTGFYLSKTIKDKGSLPGVKTASRILLLYIGWSLFYLLILSFSWYKSGLMSFDSYVGWSKSFLIGGSYYHLWYLAQLFWALLLFFPIIRYVPVKYRLILVVFLWMLETFAYVYSDMLGIGRGFVRLYNRFGAVTGSLGRMLPLLLTGNLIAGNSEYDRKNVIIGCCFCFVGLIAEVFLLRHFGAERFSYVLFTLPLAFFLFILIKSATIQLNFNSRILSKSGMNIYLLHPAVLFFLKELNLTDHMGLFCLCVFLTSVICIAFAYITPFIPSNNSVIR